VATTTAIAIYFLIWWIVLFTVLPWGVRSQTENEHVEPGTDPGAPAIPGLRRKLAWTTGIATAVFALCYAVYVYRVVTIDDLARLMGIPPR
jgi:predicted secreted protein